MSDGSQYSGEDKKEADEIRCLWEQIQFVERQIDNKAPEALEQFEGVRAPLTPHDPSRECTAVLLPKPRRAGSRSLGRQEHT